MAARKRIDQKKDSQSFFGPLKLLSGAKISFDQGDKYSRYGSVSTYTN